MKIDLLKTGMKYLAIVLSISAFGLFIYPGLYKYDKLDQSLPVMINRITGETKILTTDGWQHSDDYNVALDKFEEYKKEINDNIQNQNEEIKNIVLDSVRDELEIIKNEVVTATTESNNEIIFETVENVDNESIDTQVNNKESFTLGDSKERVKEVMGVPNSIYDVGPFTTWGYKLSTVHFKDGNVDGWENTSGNLLIK